MKLKALRVVLALFFFGCITFLFLDFRNTSAEWFDWFKLTQLIPAIFAASVVSVIVLLALTLLLGRVYCSVICPLGVLQDFIGWFRALFMPRKARKMRFHYSRGFPVLRYVMFALFFVAMVVGINHIGVRAWASLVEPYSIYGRMDSSMLAPVYDAANNMLADISVANDTTTFWHVEQQSYGGLVFWVSAVTLFILIVTVVAAGRLWCNTICPAGTLLGLFSRFSLLAPRIDSSKCTGCRRCEHDCKAQCIDISSRSVDHSRCVTCFNCIGDCRFDAMHYTLPLKKTSLKKHDETVETQA